MTSHDTTADTQGSPTPEGGETLEDQLQRYRERRKARNVRLVPTTLTEHEELVRVARTWAPYGRVPDEEIFEKYGITSDQFAARLHNAIQKVPIDRVTAARLAGIYSTLQK